MPDIEVDYSPSLTGAERQMLISIESPVAECIWSLRAIPHTRWWPKQDKHGRALYCLAPYNNAAQLILYYTEDEIGRLNPEIIKSDIALERRSVLPTGFSDRPKAE